MNFRIDIEHVLYHVPKVRSKFMLAIDKKTYSHKSVPSQINLHFNPSSISFSFQVMFVRWSGLPENSTVRHLFVRIRV